MENYGTYFKALRESLGLTLRKVEKQTGVSNAYLSQLESSKIKQPSPLTLNKLSELYRVPYELMMEKVGYPPLSNSVVSPESSLKDEISYKIGQITDEEELELLNYLAFIRNRKK